MQLDINQVKAAIKEMGSQTGASPEQIDAALRAAGIDSTPVLHVKFTGVTGVHHTPSSLADTVRRAANSEGLTAEDVDITQVWVVEFDVKTEEPAGQFHRRVSRVGQEWAFVVDPWSIEVAVDGLPVENEETPEAGDRPAEGEREAASAFLSDDPWA